MTSPWDHEPPRRRNRTRFPRSVRLSITRDAIQFDGTLTRNASVCRLTITHPSDSTCQATPVVDELSDADHARPLRLQAGSLRGGVGALGQKVEATATAIGVEPRHRSRHSTE